jgi:hypothetical protein
MLRMVLDCSVEQILQIRAYLDARCAAGELCYGIHISSTALMTCYAHDDKDGHHIHFIDGAEGGYAMAARQLKQQLDARTGAKELKKGSIADGVSPTPDPGTKNAFVNFRVAR